jgi:hypothetical protein
LLDAEAFQRWTEFERSAPARDRVDELAGRLAAADVALSPGQAEQLTQAIANGNPRYRQGGIADPAVLDRAGITYEPMGARQPQHYHWPAVFKEAKGILSPAQFALFEATVIADETIAKVFNQAQDARERGELPALKTVMVPTGP